MPPFAEPSRLNETRPVPGTVTKAARIRNLAAPLSCIRPVSELPKAAHSRDGAWPRLPGNERASEVAGVERAQVVELLPHADQLHG